MDCDLSRTAPVAVQLIGVWDLLRSGLARSYSVGKGKGRCNLGMSASGRRTLTR